MCLSDDSFETKLWKIIPREKMVFDWEMCKNVADFFAKIVDYKSSFTSRHSIGVAEKASLLAKYMGYDSITVQKMYLAGALHDIGKMAVGNEILEKPDKLTDENGKKLTEEDMTDGDVYLIYGDSIMLESFPGQYPGITKMVRKEQGNQEKADQYRQELSSMMRPVAVE